MILDEFRIEVGWGAGAWRSVDVFPRIELRTTDAVAPIRIQSENICFISGYHHVTGLLGQDVDSF